MFNKAIKYDNIHSNKNEQPNEKITLAVNEMDSTHFEEARKILKEAIATDVENPMLYNLIGVSYELEGNRIKASKFYRVSYFMDQTFSPASNNLNRIGKFYYNGIQNIDWGINRGGDNKCK